MKKVICFKGRGGVILCNVFRKLILKLTNKFLFIHPIFLWKKKKKENPGKERKGKKEKGT